VESRIRPAVAADAPFLAWVQQEAARSHLPQGFWDLTFPGPDADRLRIIGRMCTAKARSFCHWSGFLVAEVDGRAVAGLCGYTQPSLATGTLLFQAMNEAFDAERWSEEDRRQVGGRTAPFLTCIPEAHEDAWIVEWVATRPEYRGRGLIRSLLHEILDRGAAAGHAQSQIAVLIGNTPAQRAYEGVGFRVVDEKTHPEFERVLGSPGIRRLLR
jgi:GNAT superfamily N-acetyltransferase